MGESQSGTGMGSWAENLQATFSSFQSKEKGGFVLKFMELSSGYFGSSTNVATVVLEQFTQKALFSVSPDGVTFISVSSSLALRVPSPSGRNVFVVHKEEDASVLSVVTVNKSVRVASIDAKLSGVQDVRWSADEGRVTFTAVSEEKDEKTESFAWSGHARGEGFTCLLPRLFVWRLADASPTEIVLEEEEQFFVSSPCFIGDRLFVIVNPIPSSFPAGQKYCTNREGFVAEVLTKGNVGSLRELPNTRGVGLSRLQSALSESLLLWVTAKSKTLHKSSTSLFGMDPVLAKRPLAYISNHDDLTFAVSSNSPNLFYTFLRRSVSVVGHFDLNSGAFSELTRAPVSAQLLDVRGDKCLVGFSSQSSGVSIVVVNSELHVSVLADLVEPNNALETTVVRCAQDDNVDYILHRREGEKNTLLCLFLHGGPHSAVTTAWSKFVDMMMQENISVMAPNYTGSLGQPEGEKLAGRIGDLDVASVAMCLQLEMNTHSYSGVVVCGGSHGGFIAAHMLSRPEFSFIRAYAIRNPVVSLYSNFQASDIPDWVLAEGLGARERDVVELNGLSSADVEELRSKSPLYACAKHVNKESKVLIGLGGKDQRVPSFQGKTLYYCLKAKHVDVKVNFYPNELHGLDGANQEHWLRSIISLFKEATDV